MCVTTHAFNGVNLFMVSSGFKTTNCEPLFYFFMQIHNQQRVGNRNFTDAYVLIMVFEDFRAPATPDEDQRFEENDLY